MNRLYMIGLGGHIKGANIEVHDLQFIVTDNEKQIHNDMIDRWYGNKLHIDSITIIDEIDGYRIDFNTISDKNLYCIVYGGYKTGVVDELHTYHFLLATSKEEAKNIAKEQLSNFNMDHVDQVIDVFDNVGLKFGFKEGSYKQNNNEITHTFIKLKE